MRTGNWVQSDAGEDVGIASIVGCGFLCVPWGVALDLFDCLAPRAPWPLGASHDALVMPPHPPILSWDGLQLKQSPLWPLAGPVGSLGVELRAWVGFGLPAAVRLAMASWACCPGQPSAVGPRQVGALVLTGFIRTWHRDRGTTRAIRTRIRCLCLGANGKRHCWKCVDRLSNSPHEKARFRTSHPPVAVGILPHPRTEKVVGASTQWQVARSNPTTAVRELICARLPPRIETASRVVWQLACRW